MSPTSTNQVVCWGEVLWDAFPSGALLGGAISNVAIHLAQLGEQPSLITRVGQDELGTRAIQELGDRGVLVDVIQRDDQRETGRVEVTISDGEPTYRLVHDCSWECIEVTEQGRKRLESANVVSFGSLSQFKRAGFRSWREAIGCVNNKALLVYDMNFRRGYLDWTFIEEALAVAHVVKVNERETKLLAEHLKTENPIGCLLSVGNTQLVAQTLGGAGCVLSTPERTIELPCSTIAVGGDRVGAGDGFVAALIYGLLRNRDLGQIGVSANLLAGYVASQPGATPVLPADLIECIRSPKIPC